MWRTWARSWRQPTTTASCASSGRSYRRSGRGRCASAAGCPSRRVAATASGLATTGGWWDRRASGWLQPSDLATTGGWQVGTEKDIHHPQAATQWFDHPWWVVDWEHGGARIKAFPPSVVRNERYSFREGWTYRVPARASLGFRVLPPGVFSAQGAGVVPRAATAMGPLVNCRLSSALIRSMTAQM